MEALGINIINIAIYIVLFAILYVMLDKFLFKKLSAVLEERQKKIDESVTLTDKLNKKNVKAGLIVDKKVKNAKQEAQLIIDEAKEIGKKEKEKILKEAKIEADWILKKAQEKADKVLKTAQTNNKVLIEEEAKKIIEKEILEGSIKIPKSILVKNLDKL